MHRTLYALLILSCANLVSASGSTSIEEGRVLYQQFCQRCHGANLVNTGASTYDLRSFPKDAKNRFTFSVNEGLNAMPPYSDILTTAEIDSLYAYIVFIQTNQIIATPARGVE